MRIIEEIIWKQDHEHEANFLTFEHAAFYRHSGNDKSASHQSRPKYQSLLKSPEAIFKRYGTTPSADNSLGHKTSYKMPRSTIVFEPKRIGVVCGTRSQWTSWKKTQRIEVNCTENLKSYVDLFCSKTFLLKAAICNPAAGKYDAKVSSVGLKPTEQIVEPGNWNAISIANVLKEAFCCPHRCKSTRKIQTLNLIFKNLASPVMYVYVYSSKQSTCACGADFVELWTRDKYENNEKINSSQELQKSPFK